MSSAILDFSQSPVLNFTKSQGSKIFFGGLALASAATLGASFTPPASAQAVAPDQFTDAIEIATASVDDLGDLTLKALTIGLIPLGCMLTLKYLHMIMSRA